VAVKRDSLSIGLLHSRRAGSNDDEITRLTISSISVARYEAVPSLV
jgi:hypothetical protein